MTEIDESTISEEKKDDENGGYIPRVETKLSPEKRHECREIVQEIKRYGVNQRQLLYLIQLLTLEIENTEVMKKMVAVISYNREEVDNEGSEQVTKKTLIL